MVNAYVGPVLERYLERLAKRLADAGYAGPILIMQSHGGLATVADAFHRRHEALYTYSLRDQEAVLVNARLAVVGRLPAVPAEPALAQGLPGTPGATRRAYLGSWRELSVYELDTLAPGQRIEGPAIVESATTTVLLRAGDTAHTTPHGWLDIAIATT